MNASIATTASGASTRLLALGALLAGVASTTPAEAQGQPQAHWDDDGGNACVPAFERAQRARLHGELVDARARLPECLAEACPARVRDDCTRMRVELDGAIPTVAFAVRDSAGLDVDATVTVDGAPVAVEGGRAGALDPGPHIVTYTVAGQAPRTTRFRLYEGEKSRLIILTARADANAADANVTVAEGAHRTAWPFVLGGAGVLLLASSVFFVVRANSESADARDAARSVPSGVGPCQDFGGAPADSRFCNADKNARTATSLAWATGAAGVTALGSAAVVWLLESRAARSGRTPAPGAAVPRATARVLPAVGASSAGASLDLTF